MCRCACTRPETMKSENDMRLSYGDRNRGVGGSVMNGVFSTTQRKVDLDFATALWTLELQASTTLADFIGNDALAVIAANGYFSGICCHNRRCHIKLLFYLPVLPVPADCIPADRAVPYGKTVRSVILGGNLPYCRNGDNWFLSIYSSTGASFYEDRR